MDRLFKTLQKQNCSLEDFKTLLTQSKQDPSFDINAYNRKGVGLLHLAITSNDQDFVGFLLREPGIDSTLPDRESGWSPLIYAIIFGCGTDIIQLLMHATGSVEERDPQSGFCAMHWAAKNNRSDVLSLLHHKQADINCLSYPSQDTPLHIACTYLAEDAASWLIAADANLNARNVKGEVPVHIAVQQRLSNVVRKMLDSEKLNVKNCCDKEGNTPLHIAQQQELEHLSRLLENRGFSSTQANELGLTPCDICAMRESNKVEEIRRKIVGKQIKDEKKKTEKEMHKKQTEVTQFLERYNLPELVHKFYAKKILFIDQYFLELNDTMLKKIGLQPDERVQFFKALKQREEDIEMEARRAEREEQHKKMMNRKWRQFLGVVVSVVIFFCVFVVLKFVEYYRRSMRTRRVFHDEI